MWIVTLNSRPVAEFHFKSDAQKHIEDMMAVVNMLRQPSRKNSYSCHYEDRGEKEPELTAEERVRKLREERMEIELAKSREQLARKRAYYASKHGRSSRRRKQ